MMKRRRSEAPRLLLQQYNNNNTPPHDSKQQYSNHTSNNNNSNNTIMTKLKIVGICTAALSLSTMVSFHPPQQQKYNDLLIVPFHQRARERQIRTRPPRQSKSIMSNVTTTSTSTAYKLLLNGNNEDDHNNDGTTAWKTVEGYHQDLCGDHASAAVEKYPQYYPQHLLLNPKARIVITNILSSLGMHLALKLSKDCNVEAILGIDAMFPNTHKNRIQTLERYAQLKRRIPAFQKIIIPYTGVLPKLDVDRIHKFRSTHIVHLVPTYLQQQQQQQHPLYPLRDKLQGMEQLLDIIHKSTHITAMNTNTKPPPQLVYAGQNILFEQVLASSYNALYKIPSIALELPRLYGPWGEPGSWPWSWAEGIVQGTILKTMHNNSTTTSETTIPDDESYLYVEDAVAALLAAMQFKKGNSFTALKLTSDTTKASLEKAIAGGKSNNNTTTHMLIQKNNDPQHHWQDWIHWMPDTRSLAGVEKLISWHYTQHAHPYGRKTHHRKLPLYVMENFHYQFPCMSECSIPGSCTPSVYDAVARVTRKLTKGCKFVVYMVNINSTDAAVEIPAIDPPTNETSYLCQLAFVSSSNYSTFKVVKKNG